MTTSTPSKIVLITGATAGIGRTTALHLASLGHHVIATGRRADQLAALRAEALAKQVPGRLDVTALDVTSLSSIDAAVVEVNRLTAGHGVDVLVNNAGFGLLGPMSEISDAELRRQFDTNVFGLMSVTRAFLPAMRARRAGRIINVSSIGGRITLPYFGAYNGTKYAVESFSDALRYELRPFGVDVVLIEPGAIKTSFGDTAMSSIGAYADTVYGPAMDKAEQMRTRMESTAGSPETIARGIARAIKARRPAARYVLPRFNRSVFVLQALLPQRAWDWSMRRLGYLTPAVLEPAARPERSAPVPVPVPVPDRAPRAQA